MNRTSARLLALNPQVLKRLAKYMALHSVAANSGKA
jgi:hypothetical protein